MYGPGLNNQESTQKALREARQRALAKPPAPRAGTLYRTDYGLRYAKYYYLRPVEVYQCLASRHERRQGSS